VEDHSLPPVAGDGHDAHPPAAMHRDLIHATALRSEAVDPVPVRKHGHTRRTPYGDE
jgi:hypothetical protein